MADVVVAAEGHMGNIVRFHSALSDKQEDGWQTEEQRSQVVRGARLFVEERRNGPCVKLFGGQRYWGLVPGRREIKARLAGQEVKYAFEPPEVLRGRDDRLCVRETVPIQVRKQKRGRDPYDILFAKPPVGEARYMTLVVEVPNRHWMRLAYEAGHVFKVFSFRNKAGGVSGLYVVTYRDDAEREEMLSSVRYTGLNLRDHSRGG